MRISNRRYVTLLCCLFFLYWLFMALDPLDRKVWALENALVFLFLSCLAAMYRHLPLSRLSYTLIFLFLCLHEVGAHYTYAAVPYDDFFIRLTGRSLKSIVGWQRHNFDRIVHFCYGLLFAYPIREIYLRVVNVKGFWGYFLPLDLTMSTSMIYEIFEWIGGEYFGGQMRQAFLAEQGDPWDSQKDMALATLGAIIAMTLNLLLNMYFKRDFAREWVESLRVKRREPLGEEKAIELLVSRKELEKKAGKRPPGEK